MTVSVKLAAQTAAGTSGPTVVPADGRVTFGMRALNGATEIPIGEYLSCPIWISNGTTNVGRPRNRKGQPIVLTTSSPQVVIEGAGTYVVDKGVSLNAVEIWSDNGT